MESWYADSRSDFSWWSTPWPDGSSPWHLQLVGFPRSTVFAGAQAGAVALASARKPIVYLGTSLLEMTTMRVAAVTAGVRIMNLQQPRLQRGLSIVGLGSFQEVLDWVDVFTELSHDPWSPPLILLLEDLTSQDKNWFLKIEARLRRLRSRHIAVVSLNWTSPSSAAGSFLDGSSSINKDTVPRGVRSGSHWDPWVSFVGMTGVSLSPSTPYLREGGLNITRNDKKG